MLKHLLIGSVTFFGIAVAQAAPKDDVLSAAKKLADGENYSWSTSTEGPFGGGGTIGKTQKDGLTQLSITMRDQTMDIVLHGEKGAAKLEEGWQSLDELRQNNEPGGGPNPGRMALGATRNFKTPADQAIEFVGKMSDVQATEDGYAGELAPEDAKAMLQPRGGRGRGPGGGQGGPPGGAPNAGGLPPGGAGEPPPDARPPGPPEVKDASCAIKFWTKDGVLSKFQYNVKGVVNMRGEDREIDRTTTVEIKDIGTTKIDVPEEAQAKLK